MRPLHEFDRRIDALWLRLGDKYPVVLRRDSQHLNWRYARRPSVQYEVHAVERKEQVLGYAVLRTRRAEGTNLGLIVELVCEPLDVDVARALVSMACQRLIDLGVEAITCVLPDHMVYAAALRAEGFVRVPSWLAPRQFHLMVRVGREDPTIQQTLDGRNWYLAWGDNDAV